MNGIVKKNAYKWRLRIDLWYDSHNSHEWRIRVAVYSYGLFQFTRSIEWIKWKSDTKGAWRLSEESFWSIFIDLFDRHRQTRWYAIQLITGRCIGVKCHQSAMKILFLPINFADSGAYGTLSYLVSEQLRGRYRYHRQAHWCNALTLHHKHTDVDIVWW